MTTKFNTTTKLWFLLFWMTLHPASAQEASPSVTAGQSSEAQRQASDAPPVCISRHPQAVPLCECFAIESLSEDDQKFSRELLLKALDSEALFTVAGGMKPVSEGFFSTRFRVSPPDTSELDRVRRVIAPWRCGSSLEAGVLVFENLHEGERFAAGWIANRPALDVLLTDNADHFGRFGLTAQSSAESIMLSIERASQPDERWRGFGLAFGYPKFAIDFFVRAGLHQRETGEFIERDFRQYPTFSRETGGFVYAIPQVTPEQACEVLLRKSCETTLSEYKRLRAAYTVGEEVHPEKLLRDWYNDGTGWCHPDHARQKIAAKLTTP